MGWSIRAANRAEWARHEALPQAQELAEDGQFAAAFALAEEASRFIQGDPALEEVWDAVSEVVVVDSDPAGADVYVRDYNCPSALS